MSQLRARDLGLAVGQLPTGQRNKITDVPGVSACGDCRSGQSLVVKSMAEGRACAQAVADYLS